MSVSEKHEFGRAACAAALASFLTEASDLRLAANGDPVACQRRQILREWQAARLARTHADLLASPRYGRAAEFFLSDLYGPKDFSARDSEVARILPMLTAMLPVSGLRTILLAVEVDALSERFDAAMVRALGAQLDARGLTDEAYARAYREVGDPAGRSTQIDLIGETGEALDALARKPFVRGILKMMHGPAQLAGLGELHLFLERGFEAFSSIKGHASGFLESIVVRERIISSTLFVGSGLASDWASPGMAD